VLIQRLVWEFPQFSDAANLVALCREIRRAFTEKDPGWELTVTIPMEYLTMRYFNVEDLESVVDFFNVMTYDIHGPWDQPDLWDAQILKGHANLTEIGSGLDLLWKNGITADKVVMGFSFLGRGFLLHDPSCTTPGRCWFQGASFSSDCTNTPGISSYQGIYYFFEPLHFHVSYDMSIYLLCAAN
jgi:GH18 family chitinase